MKIEISNESFEFLKDLVHEMETQDRACTADPYFYVIQEPVERLVPDLYGETKYLIKDDHEAGVLDEDDTIDYFEDMRDDDEDESDNTIESLLDDGLIEEVSVTEEYEDTDDHNVFFTKKAYEEHIKRNGHNLRQPRPYIRHAYRNNEIENLFKAIKEIVNNKKGEQE